MAVNRFVWVDKGGNWSISTQYTLKKGGKLVTRPLRILIAVCDDQPIDKLKISWKITHLVLMVCADENGCFWNRVPISTKQKVALPCARRWDCKEVPILREGFLMTEKISSFPKVNFLNWFLNNGILHEVILLYNV